jgi:hypothetical protein
MKSAPGPRGLCASSYEFDSSWQSMSDEEIIKESPRSGDLIRLPVFGFWYSVFCLRFPTPFFCAEISASAAEKAKKLFELRLAHSAKKGEFFFARRASCDFWHPRRGRKSRVAFLFGYFFFGEAKKKYRGCGAQLHKHVAERINPQRKKSIKGRKRLKEKLVGGEKRGVSVRR